jgi:hypothetical protein
MGIAKLGGSVWESDMHLQYLLVFSITYSSIRSYQGFSAVIYLILTFFVTCLP